MSRPLPVVAALAALLFAALLPNACRLLGRSNPPVGGEQVEACDPLSSEGGSRWRHSEASHWRGCMMQH